MPITTEKDLVELAAVVRAVVADTSFQATRARLLLPWVRHALRRRRWRDLVSVLAPLLPDTAPLKVGRACEIRLAQIFIDAERKRPRSAVDVDGWRSAISDRTGVPLPSSPAADGPKRGPAITTDQLLATIVQLADLAAVRSSAPSATRASASPPPSERAQLVFTPGSAAPAGRAASSPSILELAGKSAEPKPPPSLDQFVESESERLEREAAERRARLEARPKLVVTLPGGPGGNSVKE
jgi:hypothetical protein